MENSMLRNLPPEIRTYIYELALNFTKCRLRIQHKGPLDLSRTGLIDCGKADPHPLALSQTCRAFREESDSIFFAVNTFEVLGNALRAAEHTLAKSISLIGEENTQALRSIKLYSTKLLACWCHRGDSSLCKSCEEDVSPLERLYAWSLTQPKKMALHV